MAQRIETPYRDLYEQDDRNQIKDWTFKTPAFVAMDRSAEREAARAALQAFEEAVAEMAKHFHVFAMQREIAAIVERFDVEKEFGPLVKEGEPDDLTHRDNKIQFETTFHNLGEDPEKLPEQTAQEMATFY